MVDITMAIMMAKIIQGPVETHSELISFRIVDTMNRSRLKMSKLHTNPKVVG
jgi:hypothetical protein